MARILSGAELTDVLDVDIEYAPVFAYGTLREGEALESLLNVQARTPARVHGASLYVRPSIPFPFMVMNERDKTVHGELLWCVRDFSLLSTVAMELNSGYDLTVVNVYTDALEEYVPAISFTYPQPPVGTQRIPSGDWKRR